jgi:hypothetical protein
MELLEEMEVKGKGGIEAMVNVPGDKDDDPGHRFRFKPLLDRPAQVEGDDGDRLTVSLTEYSGAHALLRAVYLNQDQPLSRRIRCAIAALPYEVPKLAVSSGGGGRDFAAQLEAARKRSGKGLVIEHQPEPVNES